MAKRRSFMLSASQHMQQVRLPPEFITKSRALADNLLKDAVHRYHAHCHDRGGRVDAKRWKLVKDKHHVACYRSLAKPSGSGFSGSGSASGDAPTEILAVGAIAGGALEDALHGVVNLTPEAMHVENALAQGDLVDSRILAFISPPSPADPFDAVTVKWVLRDHAPVTEQRDYVYVEAAGLTTAPDGEPLGFLLAHSVTLAAVPEFHKDSHISRGQLSYCYLFRESKTRGVVEVFFRGALHPRGGVKDRVAMGLTVDMVVNACPTSLQLARMKKLVFCLRTLPTTPETESIRDHAGRSSPSSLSSHSSHSSCSSCSASTTSKSVVGTGRSRSLGSNGSFLRRLTSFSTGSASGPGESGSRRTSVFSRVHSHSVDSARVHGSACDTCGRHFNALKTKARCQLCHKLVCGRCRVVKRVVAFEELTMHSEKLDLCHECVANTSNTSAAWIAAQELHELARMLEEKENEKSFSTSGAGGGGPRASSDRIRKPIWELNTSPEDRQTLSSEFSTRSSTGDRYLVSLTGSGSVAAREDAKNAVTDLEKLGLEDVDEDLSASGVAHKLRGFVLGDSEDEADEDEDEADEDEMPIVDSFVDDEFFFLDESDEIFVSVK